MRISVIIPVYNGGKYLRQAIESAIGQTYRDVEIIVVNDGSNDAGQTRAIAQSYQPRIRYVEQENRGVAGALNAGLAAMTGEIFCWLSHDDVYRPNKIERQAERFLSLGRPAAALFSNYALIDERGRVIAETAMERVIGNKPKLALLRGCINGCTIFLPRLIFERLGSFDETLRYTQDYDMWKRMAAAHRFVHMPETLVDQRMHAEQGSKSPAATEEANRLWITLTEETSPADRIAIAGSSFRFFQSQGEFLAATPYRTAAAHALRRAARCLDDMPKVSVVIPFYNEVAATERAIRSALAQTHRDLEVIAVDDGSSDDTGRIEAMTAADARLRIIRQPNGGPASARNTGMRFAQGEYIAFLDADDTWTPDKIAVQTRRMQESGCLFCHTSYHAIHPERSLGPAIQPSGRQTGFVYPAIIAMCPVSTSTVMIHRKLFEDGHLFVEALRLGEDCLLWIDIAQHHPILGLDVALTTMEWSDDSAAINLCRSIEGTRNLLDALSNSAVHATHEIEIAKLRSALDRLEATRNRLGKQNLDSQIDPDRLLHAFKARAALSLGVMFGTRALMPLLMYSSRTLLRHGRAATRSSRSRLLASAKRVARAHLPLPAIAILKRLLPRTITGPPH
jgi:hypothetical protein